MKSFCYLRQIHKSIYPKWISVVLLCRCSGVLSRGGWSGGATCSPAELHRQLSRDHEQCIGPGG